MNAVNKNVSAWAAAGGALAVILLAPVAGRAAGQRAFTSVSAHKLTVTPAKIATAQKAVTKGKLSGDRKTISFSGSTVILVVSTGPENDMLTYRINGLRNPTLVIRPGATLKILFVNTDDDMAHNIRFGSKPAAFTSVADSLLKASAGTPPLPHGADDARPAEAITIRAPRSAGSYAYFCTVRGHANGGMWGIVLVR